MANSRSTYHDHEPRVTKRTKRTEQNIQARVFALSLDVLYEHSVHKTPGKRASYS